MDLRLSPEALLLIKKFHLEKYLPTVRISFFYGTNPRIYLIAFNSTRRNQIVTKLALKQFLNVGFMQGGKRLDSFSPPVDITFFNGNIGGNITFIIADLANLQIPGGKKFLETEERDFKIYHL